MNAKPALAFGSSEPPSPVELAKAAAMMAYGAAIGPLDEGGSTFVLFLDVVDAVAHEDQPRYMCNFAREDLIKLGHAIAKTLQETAESTH